MNLSGQSSGLGTQRRMAGRGELRTGDSLAFTLLEILVVVAIMGIVFSISIPFMNTAIIGNKGINGAMKMIQEACSDARALAILKQSTAVFVIHRDGSIIDVRAGASSGRGRGSSPDVAGDEWRAPEPSSGVVGPGGGGRVEMKLKYPAKLPEGVEIEAILANGVDASELDMAEVRFYADGTCDEFNVILRHRESGERRQVWLEITTSLPDIETDPAKFTLH